MRKILMLVLNLAVFIMFSCIVSAVYFIANSTFRIISQDADALTADKNSIISETSNDPPSGYVSPSVTQASGRIPVRPVSADTDIIFNFMGDCTLGTYCGEFTEGRFNATAEIVEPEYFFAGVKDILDSGTFNITNCEGVLTDNPLEEIYKDYDPAYWFKSPAKNAGIFSQNGICAVGISNNHIGDYGQEGIADTKQALTDCGVKWSNASRPIYLEKDGRKAVIFCVCLWDDECPERICDQIREYSLITDLQIVFFHGGTENIHEPDPHKIDYSHRFVDAGADLVVGSHPHVLQPLEVYNGVNILYSLGNFVYGGNTAPENRTIVYQHKFSFRNNKLAESKETIYPCYIYTGEMNAFQPTLIEDEANRQQVLDFMYGNADSPFL